MKILIIHNTYQIPGGEQVIATFEAQNLRAHGHDVVTYTRTNAELDTMSLADKMLMPKRMTWASDAVADIRKLIRQERPDLAHIHNTHFMISPAAIHACASEGIPVIKTLHNFRLICPAATLFRDGHVCEDCIGKPIPYPGVRHRCFRGSRSRTLTLATNTTFHRYRGTWDQVSHYITPTEFTRQKMIEGGFDGQRITAKPHFLMQDPGIQPTIPRERFILYVGRFTAEKGSNILLEAWKNIPDIPLKMVGDGPLMADAVATLRENPQLPVELLGRLSREQVESLMRRAYALVIPSECYETFGMVAVEGFAVGTPVIASGHGAPAELIRDGKTGLHFKPGDAQDLAAKVCQLCDNPQQVEIMRGNARHTFEQQYTAEQNYHLLIDIYQRVLAGHRAS